jgi:hypothetical protein
MTAQAINARRKEVGHQGCKVAGKVVTLPSNNDDDGGVEFTGI